MEIDVPTTPTHPSRKPVQPRSPAQTRAQVVVALKLESHEGNCDEAIDTFFTDFDKNPKIVDCLKSVLLPAYQLANSSAISLKTAVVEKVRAVSTYQAEKSFFADIGFEQAYKAALEQHKKDFCAAHLRYAALFDVGNAHKQILSQVLSCSFEAEGGFFGNALDLAHQYGDYASALFLKSQGITESRWF